MSRIGKKKIDLPSGVTVATEAGAVKISGPKGKLSAPVFEGIQLVVEPGAVSLTRSSEDKAVRAKHGLARALIANHVKGVTQGYTKTLLLTGVGYRATKKGKQLSLALGFSHEVLFPEPADVGIAVPEPTKIVLTGIDKQRVGQTAAQIRAHKPPEPYKGKGIKYEDEHVRRKAGKAGKK